jgi:tetratricopeptide (TPR) repeat protein
LGEIFLFQGDYDTAIAQWRKTLEINPEDAEAPYYLSYGYELKGQYDEAIRYWCEGVANDGHPEIAADIKHVYASSGWKAVLRDKIERSDDPHKPGLYDPQGVADTYAKLGENDKALAWLERSYAEKVPMPFLQVDPDLKKLHSEPRFQDLVRRIGFPQ